MSNNTKARKHDMSTPKEEIEFIWEVLLANPDFKIEYEKQLMIRTLAQKEEQVDENIMTAHEILNQIRARRKAQP